MNESSISLRDYLYNLTNARFMGDKYLSHSHYFVALENGKYQYVRKKSRI